MAHNISSTELGEHISALSNDVVNANIHWRMRCDLIDSLQKHPLVGAQSNTFWHYTLKAHETAAIINLCRVFEKRQDTLNLLEWLKTIQSNLNLFETSKFKKRLAGNAFVDSLASDARCPDKSILETDIKNCVKDDPLVEKLMFYRDNFFAHKNTDIAIGNKLVQPEQLPSNEDISALLERAITIFNRYSKLFQAVTYSTSVIGKDDYKFIFSCVSSAVEESRRKTQEFLDNHKN
jgi:AbiU2